MTAAIPIRRFAVAVAALLATTSCTKRDPVHEAMAVARDGSAKAALQAFFDRHRQCGPFLFGGEAGRYRAEPRDPVTTALVSAGLIEKLPARAADSAEYFRPTTGGQQWFVERRFGASSELSLCYARRKVRTVFVEAAGLTAYLRYTYEFADLAPWLHQPAIRRAVPTLALLTEPFSTEYLGDEKIRVEDGRPQIEGSITPNSDGYLFQSLQANFRGMSLRDIVEIRLRMERDAARMMGNPERQ